MPTSQPGPGTEPGIEGWPQRDRQQAAVKDNPGPERLGPGAVASSWHVTGAEKRLEHWKPHLCTEKDGLALFDISRSPVTCQGHPARMWGDGV